MKSMTAKTLAVHSYKGGTGKTTLVTNLAATYAQQGLKVCLIDVDLYAPSLSIYFKKTPEMYINDLLSGDAQISDILFDLTPELDLKGNLWLGFANPRKEAIQEIEIKHDLKWQLTALKRLLAAKKELIDKYQLDYLFLDTSPGIRYWSVNTLAAADTLLLLMKDSDMDIEGTRKMINDIYDSLSRFGSKYYVVLNKVPGQATFNESIDISQTSWIEEVERVVGAQVIGSIPCFCDIQFNRHEYLFAIKQPNHPFSKSISAVSEKIKTLP
jgi:chromosome partitioning protein